MKILNVIIVTGVLLCSTSCSNKSAKQQYIDNLMSEMTLEEKIGQLNLPAGGNIVTGSVMKAELDSLILKGRIGGFFNVKGIDNIYALQKLSVEKGPHGIPMLVGADVVHGYETIFPIPLALSCSWDSTAIERMAQISAIEATAEGVNWNFSPMVDICRDPRWGRIAEGSGEDPYLGCVMARAYVRGYQGKNLSSDSTLMACVKHFALYGAVEGGRDYNTVDMSNLNIFNYYLPPFKAAVDAGCASLMTSFNLINGTHSTASDWLINGVLRKDWKFNGLVVSDYNSIPEVAYMGTSDINDAGAYAIRAGTDMDMVSSLYLNTLQDAVKRGVITESTIDDACRRVLEAKWDLGLFEDPYRYCNSERTKTDIYNNQHRSVAREIASETFVLLKNESSLLPIKNAGTIALIGPLADAGNNMCGTWSTHAKAEHHKSVLSSFKEAFAKTGTKVLYAKGSNIYYDEITELNANGDRQIERGDNEALLSEALKIAGKSDIIITALGETAGMNGESASRAEIYIPDAQRNLLKALSKTGKPIVLLLFTGRPLVLDWESENIPAILNVWFGGSEAADAIADVVLGNKVPSGKLTTTFPRSIGQIPLYYNHLMPSHPDPQFGIFNRYASNYIDVPNEPLYPFGYGLSYTQFVYGQPTASSNELSPNQTIEIDIDVTNAGDYDGTEIVQLYIRDIVAQIARPVKELKAFKRVKIEKGKTKRVSFTITLDDLKYYNQDMQFVYDPGEFEIMVGPNSSNLQTLTINAL